MRDFTEIITQPTFYNKVRVVVPYIYKDICIDKGFESDGATIPRLFWVLFPPFSPNYLTASLVHDYLCQREQYQKADSYFEEILLISSVGTFTRVSLVFGVNFWHRIAYKANNKPRFWLSVLNKLKEYK